MSSRLKILAEYYFYPWEIEDAACSDRPGKKLAQKVIGSRRCLSHCSNHSYETTSSREVLFWLKSSKPIRPGQKEDYRSTVDQLAEALFTKEKQLTLFQ